MQSSTLRFQYARYRHRLLRASQGFVEHRHSFFEIAWVLSGEALWHLRDKRPIRLREGEAIVIPPTRYHSEKATRLTSFAWLGFWASDDALTGIPVERRLRAGETLDVLIPFFDRLEREERERLPLYHERTFLILSELLLLLRRHAIPGEASLSHPSSPETAIEASRSYLRRNLREEITMAQVARYHGLSLSHFEALFSSQFGETPKQFQQKCRLQVIQRWIRDGDRTTKAMAGELGFNDAAYFCRWFKKRTGMTPRSYRESVL